MLKQILDSRGLLSIVNCNDLPFMPKRVFVRENIVLNEIIGNHYHKKLQEVIFVLQGSCNVVLQNMVNKKIESFKINAGDNLYLKTNTKLKLTSCVENTSIIVFCNELYDPEDVFSD